MCTLTIVNRAHEPDAGLRVLFNRDEQRTRGPALPPSIVTAGEISAIMPVDPDSGGTWIAANSAGLFSCLLNATPPGGTRHPPGRRSRGEIVPLLAACRSLDAAAALLDRIDPARYPPFRLLILHEQRLVVAASDGRALTADSAWPLTRPVMLTSSGLGDHLVERPRRELFEQMFAPPADVLAAQRAFHDHSWPGRSHLSVNMSRDDARTVSQTLVDLRAGAVVMTYRPVGEDGVHQSHTTVTLPIESEALR